MMKEWNINSNDNALFVTAQCNNRCIMCCQPPICIDDIEDRYQRNLELIKHAPKGIKVVGITGGEPTLLGDKLISLVQHIRHDMPDAAIQLLSNGRKFSDLQFTKKLKDAGGDNLFVGIPIHSDYSKDHDLIAGVNGAFEETMLGLYNLNTVGIDIELRVVINALNYKRLPLLSEFIFRNLPFVSWIAFMGMEHIGYAITNNKDIWVEPIQYKYLLEEAVCRLSDWGVDVCIFNIPLCLLSESSRRFSKKSISDWKIRFSDCCNNCLQRINCCGLFGTSKQQFLGLKSI